MSTETSQVNCVIFLDIFSDLYLSLEKAMASSEFFIYFALDVSFHVAWTGLNCQLGRSSQTFYDAPVSAASK